VNAVLQNNAKLYAEMDVDPDFDDAGLGMAAARVYVHLHRLSNSEHVSMPTITTIATRTRMNRETAIKAIRELEERGFLKVDRHWGNRTVYHMSPKHAWKPVPKTDQYLKPTSRKEEPVLKIVPTSTYNRLVPAPLSSPSPLVSSSVSSPPSPAPLSPPPLTPPPTPLSSSNTHTVAPELTLVGEQARKPPRDKSRPESEQQVVEFVRTLRTPAGMKLPDSSGSYMWNHWLGNGFTNGGKAMKDWKAVIRSWVGAGHLPQKNCNVVPPNGAKKPRII
jgi:hypothetical protein